MSENASSALFFAILAATLYGVPANNEATVPLVLTSCSATATTTTVAVWNRRATQLKDVTARFRFFRFDRGVKSERDAGSPYGIDLHEVKGYESRTVRIAIGTASRSVDGMYCSLVSLTTREGHVYTYPAQTPVTHGDRL